MKVIYLPKKVGTYDHFTYRSNFVYKNCI